MHGLELLRGLRPTRVDVVDVAAPRFDRLQAPDRVGQLDEASAGHCRVRPDDDQALGSIDVRKRLDEREPVDALRNGELVVAVLRTGLKEII